MPQSEELKGVVQRMIDAGEPESAIGSVIQRWSELHPATLAENQATLARANETPIQEPTTYGDGFMRGAQEGAAGGLVGFMKGAASAPARFVQNAPAMGRQFFEDVTDPVAAGSRIMENARQVGRTASTDPEAWGHAIGDLAGQTIMGSEAPEMPAAGLRGVGKVVAGTGRFLENHPNVAKEAAAVAGATAGGAVMGPVVGGVGYLGSRYMGHLAGAKLGRELVPHEAVENVGRSMQESGRNLYDWAGGVDADSLLSANRPPVGAKVRGSLGEEIGKQRETMAQDRQLQTAEGERGLAEGRAQQETSRLERMVQQEANRAETERLRANPPRLVKPAGQTPSQQMIDMLSQEDAPLPDEVTGAPPQTLTPTGRPSLTPDAYEDLVTAPSNIKGRTVGGTPEPPPQTPQEPISLGGQVQTGAVGAKIRQLVEEQMRQATARPTAEAPSDQVAAPVAPMAAHEPRVDVSSITPSRSSGERAPFNPNLSVNDVRRGGGNPGVRYKNVLESKALQVLIDRAKAARDYVEVANLEARQRHLLDSPNQ